MFARTVGIRIDIPVGTTGAAFKPNYIAVARVVVPKLRQETHMPRYTRAVCLTVGLMLAAAFPGEAQGNAISVTIARGPHAGRYEFTGGQCDPLEGGQIISLFTAEMAGLVAGPKTPERIELYTEPGRGKTNGLMVKVLFRTPSRQRVEYEIYDVPPALQGPGLNEPARGKGAVTMEENAKGARASFKGETQEGIGMEGSISCPKK